MPSLRGCLHYRPWGHPKALQNLQLVVKLVPRPLRLHQGKKISKWPWSLRALEDIFQGLHYPLTSSNGLCDGRGKRGALVGKRQGPMTKKFCHNNFLMIFFGEKTTKIGEDKEWSNLIIIFQNCPLWTYNKNKMNISTFWCMVIPLDPHSLYT